MKLRIMYFLRLRKICYIIFTVMTMNDKLYLIRKAGELLERTTPLISDCGRLCDGKCCKGDGKTGMFLFPDEEEILKNVDGFRIIDCEGNFGYKMVICDGECDRKTRPLACRIYPYFPMITDDGFDVRADIRGIGSCPLLYNNMKVDHAFLRQIRKVARLFSRDEELKNYILNINSMLNEIEEFAVRTTE